MDLPLTVETFYLLAVTYGLQVLGSLAIFVLGRWLATFLARASRRLLRQAKIDQTLIAFFGNILYYLLLVIVIIAALSNLGIPTTSIIAILGGATLALGLALQDSLGNLAAGVILILLRPYKVGDLVEINNATGFVTEIEIFHTRLRSRDNRDVFIPNKDILDNNITNYSKTELIRLDLVYGIGYGDDLLKAKQILRDILAEEERIAAEPAPVVAVMGLGDSSVDFAVRPYVRVADMIPVSFAITEQVKLRFDAEGISIPFPQRDVHLYQNTNGSANATS
jgi:small conductance mechanosensitive channel